MTRKKIIRLETPFDHLTALLCGQFDAPFGLVSVVDGDQAVFRSELGLGERGLPRAISVSSRLVEMGPGAHLVVEDALEHPVFKDHPMVTGSPGIRFFAGTTVSNGKGQPVGAVGIMDVKPRGPLTHAEFLTLDHVAQIAGSMLDQAAAQSIQSEQLALLALAEQMSGVGHWRYDVISGEVTWSDEVYRIHGYTPGEIDPSYADALGAYHPDDAPILAKAVERAISTGEGYEFRLRLQSRDRRERLVSAKATTEQDETGRTIAMFGVFQDVTDAEQAHAKVAASEARYRLLADRTTDVIGVYDLDGVFSYLSPAMENVLGHKPEEMIGRETWEFIDPRDHDSIRQAYRSYFALGPGAPAPRIPYRALHKDGSMVWLEAHPTVLWDEHGRPTEIQDAIRDITQRVALEAELIEARDRAQAAAQAKSDFLANMSHELRTPLTSVIGFSGLLEASSNLPDAERRYANRIATASEALLSVINDILDYSKLEAEAVDLDPLPFDPRVMAEGAATIVEAQCQAKGLKLTLEIASDLPAALMGDEGRLRQVMLNFLSNAVKFTAAGGDIRLTVSGDGARLKVAVTDSGIGIASDKIDQLFDRFTQADASTTRVYGGTGLGLAISRRLIAMMGGEIGADSAPGEGSTFWFAVPLITAEATGVQIMPEDAVIPMGLRVLLADDAAANRELVAAILGGLGIALDTVCDGAEAVEAARTGNYDLILMDVHMPVMDGLAAARAIRALGGATAVTPIVALTANIQPEHVERCLAAGMDGHVGKPIQMVELLGVMSRAAQKGEETARSGASEAAA